MLTRHLVAIHPDRVDIAGHYFGDDSTAALQWAAQWNAARYGIYFTVNETTASGKPRKDEISAVRFAHVDSDPPKDGSPWDKSEVLARMMAANASLVIDSGNGLQGLWAVDPGTTHEQVEAINRGLMQAFGGDAGTWNVDRLMRLPGFINYPNAKKRALGRVEARAELVVEQGGTFAPDELLRAFPDPGRPRGSSADDIDLGEWKVESIESLWLGPELTDMVRSEGIGRSEQAAKVASAMAYAGYRPEQIMGLMMNESYPWSGTIHEKADPERQARRKVAAAITTAGTPATAFEAPPAWQPPGMVTEYSEQAAKASAMPDRTGGGGLPDGGLILPHLHKEFFDGCVYITSLDRMVTPRALGPIDRSRFNVLHGGFHFVSDTTDSAGGGGKVYAKLAADAFLQNTIPGCRPEIADDETFRPLSEYGVIHDGKRKLFNVYRPTPGERKQGDPSRFVNLMEKLFPNERDRAIVLTYMASCVRHVGVKFQWWLVIQGLKGTGKSMIRDVIEYAVGPDWCFEPNTDKMVRGQSNFNGWVRNRVFLSFNEFYAGAERRKFMDSLNRLVTDRKISVEAKGVDERMVENFANGIMFTNHKDAVPLDPDERRYCVVYMGIQTPEQLLEAGLGGNFYPDFFAWLRGEGPYASEGENHGLQIIHEYLHNYEVLAEVDPAQEAHRAPRSSSYEEALVNSLGAAEQDVLEAIRNELPGFAGGWVSSAALDQLLKEKNHRVPLNKRAGMMGALGYVTHPSLPDGGRVTRKIAGQKPRLFIRDGHILLNETEPGRIAEAFEKAQGVAAASEAESRLGGR